MKLPKFVCSKKVRNIFISVAYLLFNIAAAFVSYDFGRGLISIQRFERFSFIADVEKESKSNYLNCVLELDGNNKMSYSNCYSLKLSSQSSAISYCAVGENQISRFNIQGKYTHLENIALGTVFTYSDTDIMESIPLPLYKNLGFVFGHNELGLTPCYISNIMAFDIINENPEYKTLDDFYTKPYSFSVFGDDGALGSFLVTNIYLVSNKNNEWPQEKYNQYQVKYQNYNEHFLNCAGNFIFTYSPSIFEQYGSTLVFDIKNNFGYIRNFYERCLGYNFEKTLYNPQLFITLDDNSLFNITNIAGINRFCYSQNFFEGANWLLVVPFIFFFIASIILAVKIKSGFMREKRLIQTAFIIGLGPFVLIQFIFLILNAFISSLEFSLLFNAFGNGIHLAMSICVMVMLLIQQKVLFKNEKQNIIPF